MGDAPKSRDLIDRVLALDAAPPGTPHAWIQWKGTDVCMDVNCSCGYPGHVDADFAYFYRCLGCNKVFSVGATVRLYELTEQETAVVDSGMTCAPVEDGAGEHEQGG
jgi:hypothetical protein